MRYVIAVTLSLITCCGVVQAQQLALRSGDHPTFSRLTIPMPPSQPWSARQTPTDVEVSFPGFEGSFDTAGVFMRMRRDRISKIEKQKYKLVLAVSCDCIASAFRSGPLLVIDVADRGTALAGPLLDDPNITTKRLVSLRRNYHQESNRSALPWIGSKSPFRSPASESSAIADSEKDQADARTDIGLLDEGTAVLNQIQQNLVKEVASAASNGLLNSIYDKPEELPSPTSPLNVSKLLGPKKLPVEQQTPSKNLRITSSMETGGGLPESSLETTSSGVSCPADDFLPVERWGNESSFSAQLAPARTALTDPRDRLDRDAARNLAQTYLYFGFGAEAFSTLQLDPSLMLEFRHLADMAQILKHGSIVRPNVLSHFTDCESNAALWATLSFDELTTDTIVNVDAVLLALNKLPNHLRQLIAPELSRRLLEYGDATAAATAMRSVERLPGVTPPVSLMAQADLAINAGEPAEAFLEEVIETNTEQSPSALVKLIESKLAKNEPLSAETATLVEAYAQELRGTELGNQLRQTQIITLTQTERFQEAFEALKGILPSISPMAARNLEQTIFEQLHQEGTDLVFLEHVFSNTEQTIETLPTTTKLLLAKRLLDLGFPSQTQEILSKMPDRPRLAKRQILAARSALLMLQPFQAQAELIGVEGAEAELILAQAKEMTGAYREASEIFSKNAAPRQAAQAAWLSEDWRDLTPSNATSFGAVSALAKPSAGNPSLGVLSRANSDLEESAQARGALVTLLNDPALEIMPDSRKSR